MPKFYLCVIIGLVIATTIHDIQKTQLINCLSRLLTTNISYRPDFFLPFTVIWSQWNKRHKIKVSMRRIKRSLCFQRIFLSVSYWLSYLLVLHRLRSWLNRHANWLLQMITSMGNSFLSCICLLCEHCFVQAVWIGAVNLICIYSSWFVFNNGSKVNNQERSRMIVLSVGICCPQKAKSSSLLTDLSLLTYLLLIPWLIAILAFQTFSIPNLIVCGPLESSPSHLHPAHNSATGILCLHHMLRILAVVSGLHSVIHTSIEDGLLRLVILFQYMVLLTYTGAHKLVYKPKYCWLLFALP